MAESDSISSLQLDLQRKVGQLFMPAAFINDTEEEIQNLESIIRTHGVGGLCFFHSRASAATNFEGPRKVPYNENSLGTLESLITRYQAASAIPLLISIDAEWGLAMRIENTVQFPYAITLGAVQEKDDLVYEVGRHIARDCRKAGIHWNFAPVADINLNPDNPVIGYRSFGGRKELVSSKAIAMMKGMQDGGLLTCAKHFPGHGDTETDSHLGLPVIDKNPETLEKNELFPFKQLIRQGVDAVMAGHLAVPSLTDGRVEAASVSKDIIQGGLRQRMGFNGVVVTDALYMHSVSRLFPEKGQLELQAFTAGNDILCFCENVAEGIHAIVNNAPSPQIEAAFARVWRIKEKALSFPSEVIPPAENAQQLSGKLAAASLTLQWGNPNKIKEFRNREFTLLEVSQSPSREFKSYLENHGLTPRSDCLAPDTRAIGDLPSRSSYLVGLYPPSVKPPNSFGFSRECLKWLNSLMQQNKVVLYLFGNPYVLNHLNYKMAEAVVLVYQDFRIFQENAALHFLGKSEAMGKLPVKLKKTADENI
jgi:beta-glucosidase-like glycosyl hydrolase